jgi:hypothetical protein
MNETEFVVLETPMDDQPIGGDMRAPRVFNFTFVVRSGVWLILDSQSESRPFLPFFFTRSLFFFYYDRQTKRLFGIYLLLSLRFYLQKLPDIIYFDNFDNIILNKF